MKGPDCFWERPLLSRRNPYALTDSASKDFYLPLDVDEVIDCLIQRWDVSYDLQLVVRNKRLYLQIMWAYLEQQSFPLEESAYRLHIAEVLDIVNRLGLADSVRSWLSNTPKRPRVGKALSLPLVADQRLDEFVL